MDTNRKSAGRSVIGRTVLATVVAIAALSFNHSASTVAAREAGIDCAVPGEPRLETAQQIRNGRLKLGPFPTFRLPANPTWRENPFRDVNWAFRYHTLRWVLPLIRTWLQTGDSWYVRRASYITRDWLRDNPRSAPRSSAAWGDLQTAWRAMVLACFVESVPGATWARTALGQHGRVLALSSFYRGAGNHALGQNRALIVAGCLLRRGDWIRIGVARLTRLVVGSVDSQGVTNEQAVFYQLYNYQGYSGAADRLRQCGRSVPSALRRIDRMPEFLAHATLPDRSYWMLGDTSRLRAATLRGSGAEFAATGGASGRRPADLFRAFGAGFAFGRSGWGDRRAWADEAAYSVRFGPGVRFHGHADHASLTLYAYGKRLIDDSGMFTYNNNGWRAFAMGRRAHNVVTVDGLSYRASSRASLAYSRTNAQRDELVVVDRGYAGVAQRRRILFSRVGGYLVVEDRLSSRAARTFRQHWHLDVGSAPVVGGRTVRTNRTSGNLRIIQLAVRPSVRVVKGRVAPIQGWISETLSHRRAAPVVIGSARGRSVRYLTLLVPTRGATDPVRVTNVRLTSAGWSFDIDVAGTRERVRASAWNSTITPLP
jgi:Heparinase II/III-like protein/Heparinase II/III N-terminus